MKITPVILCGGSGTRLWPLSRKSFPKQFVPLIGDKSLLQLTLERVAALSDEIVTVSSEQHRFMVTEALQSAGVDGPIILEPIGRNTTAAMAIAALQCRSDASEEDLLLFCPADHHIPNTDAFRDTIIRGTDAANSGAIVTFGIVPSSPSTAYGYIKQGEPKDASSWKVARFIEKPDAEKAQSLLLDGDTLWNAGIFLTRIDTLLKALETHAPDILSCCATAMESAQQETTMSGHLFIRPEAKSFSGCRSQSIDYAVMEPYDNVAVVPFHGQWSDVGSWNAVADLTQPDKARNRIDGQGLAHLSTDTYIHAPHRPVVALGTRELLIVDTPDAVLVAHKDFAEQVKDVVAKLESEACAQAVTHRKVARPWGWYDSLDIGNRFQVKRIGVKPGASLSLQKHHHRAEHWIVVQGTAEVTCGDSTFLLSENQSTYIPIGQLHRLNNPGKLELEIIEVQSGGYLGEDDIERFDDNYGRET
jgi:mannose-1-phosphate guanylyltransferase/mannose-6-phosphate isomerase